MAVWLLTFGKKEFSSPEEKHTECEKLVRQLHLDFAFLEGAFTEKKGELVPHFEYDSSKWVLHTDETNNIWFEYPLYLYNSLKLTFVRDFIQFIGPFDHFQNFSLLASDKNLRDGYMKIVRTIFEKFGVKEVVYCSEWFFTNEENNYLYTDLEKRMAEYPKKQVSTLEGIKGDEYCIESFE